MSRREKRLARMRENPGADWTIDQIQAVAEHFGVQWRQPGTSHVTFVTPQGNALTIPAHKPIKRVYVKQFIALLETLENEDV